VVALLIQAVQQQLAAQVVAVAAVALVSILVLQEPLGRVILAVTALVEQVLVAVAVVQVLLATMR
jgi:hypothetical protein